MLDLANLVKENEELKKQAAQNSQGIQGLLAQLEAHKQHLTESVTTALNLRSNLIFVQNANKDLGIQAESLKKTIEDLTEKLEDKSTARVPVEC